MCRSFLLIVVAILLLTGCDVASLRKLEYAQPVVNAVCVGEDGLASQKVRFGENLCSVVIEAPRGFDTSEALYTLRTYYQVNEGSFLFPDWQSYYDDLSATTAYQEQGYYGFSFPWYFADQSFLGNLERLVLTVFGAIWDNRGVWIPAATQTLAATFGYTVDEATIATLTHLTGAEVGEFKLESLGAVAQDAYTLAADLVSQDARPYAIQVIAQVCDAEHCSAYGETTVRLE